MFFLPDSGNLFGKKKSWRVLSMKRKVDLSCWSITSVNMGMGFAGEEGVKSLAAGYIRWKLLARAVD
jgi:hypothetical protein